MNFYDYLRLDWQERTLANFMDMVRYDQRHVKNKSLIRRRLISSAPMGLRDECEAQCRLEGLL